MKDFNLRKKYRREVLSEKKQIAIRFGSDKNETRECADCEEAGQMFLPEIISEVLPVSTREIYRRVEKERAHFIEINEKQILVCVNSLAKPLESETEKLLLGSAENINE